MKNKGYTIIELMITLVMIGIVASFVIPAVFTFIADEDLATKTGVFVREFKQEIEPEIKIETVEVNKSGITCQDGKKVITIGGVVYHLGIVKNSWGDLDAVDCP